MHPTPIPTQGERQITIPVDENGNAVGVIFDAVNSVYRLAVDAVFGGALVIGAVEVEDGGAGLERQSIKVDGATLPAGLGKGGALVAGIDDITVGGPFQRHIRVDGSGRLITTSAVIGTTITSPADVVLGVGATVALPAIPAGTSRMVAQVTSGDSTTEVRVREAAGAAGTGMLLLRFGTRAFGGGSGAIAALEMENVVGPASTGALQFED